MNASNDAWRTMNALGKISIDVFDVVSSARAREDGAKSLDVELYACARALARSRASARRARVAAALAQWRFACAHTVANEAIAHAHRARNERRRKREAFERWRARTPTRGKPWPRASGERRATYIAGLANGANDGESEVEFEFDYQGELEMRLTQIARLEEALREAREAKRDERGEAEVDARMGKFRAHLTNVQRELENVKRERDSYKAKCIAASAGANGKSNAERRLNQRTMATQTTFAAEDAEEAPPPPPPREPTAKEVKKMEDQWMETAQQFQRKFERQMEISNDLEKRLREERTRLMKTEAKYEERMEELRIKHDEAIATAIARMENRSASSAEVSREAFEAYAAIGKQNGGASHASSSALNAGHAHREPPMIRSSSLDIVRSPRASNGESLKSPRTSASATGAESQTEGFAAASPTEFQTATKLNFGAKLDGLSSSEDEDQPFEPYMSSPHASAPVAAKKPVRLTVAVAKLVMLGHSQRDAIEALKHVDGNDVNAALDWIAARQRSAR